MKNKAKLIMHPIRIRILLNLVNQTLTSQELSERLSDVAQATLYRHIKVLFEAGLLEVVEEHPVRGTMEKVYTLAAGGAALSVEDMAKATPEDHMRYFTVFVSSLLADFSRYLERDNIDMLHDGVGYRQVALNLDDQEMIEFSQQLNAVVIPLLGNKLEGGRKRRVFSTVLIPDDGEPPHTKGD